MISFGLLIDVVGVLVLVHLAVRLIFWAYTSYLRPLDLSKYRAKAGQSWALVTGSTDGIGLAYAKALAREGFSIILVGRNSVKLEQVKSDILAKYPKISVQSVMNDAKDVQVENIVSAVKGKQLCILVNNVGIGQGGQFRLHELKEEGIRDAVLVNDLFPTVLTHRLIPEMLKTNQNANSQRALIINVSSVAALLMNPFSSVYSGSKSFNRAFSLALSAEYSNYGIDVQCVEPGFVATKLTGMTGPSMVCCTAEECVNTSLRRHDQVEVMVHIKHILPLMITSVLEFLVPLPLRPQATVLVITWYRRVFDRKRARN